MKTTGPDDVTGAVHAYTTCPPVPGVTGVPAELLQELVKRDGAPTVVPVWLPDAPEIATQRASGGGDGDCDGVCDGDAEGGAELGEGGVVPADHVSAKSPEFDE